MSKKEKNLFIISFCENYESLRTHNHILTIWLVNILYEGYKMKKVILTFQVKIESKKEFIEFLDKNVPNVRGFDGCNSVNLYFDNETNEMIITENWESKEHHGKYIEFIAKNGVMQDLISYLQKEPTIKYYEILDI